MNISATLFLDVLVPVAAIMLLDWFRKGWRGWWLLLPCLSCDPGAVSSLLGWISVVVSKVTWDF